MNCPSCGEALRRITYQGFYVEACPECKGIWFDTGEMQQYLEFLGDSPDLPNAPLALSKRPAPTGRLNEPLRRCPRCGHTMRKFNYSYDSNIIMDRCRICSGVWTDEGEAYQAAIYNKGNPKLDKLGSSVATHVQEREDLKEFVEGVDNLARGGGALYLGIQGVLPVGDDMPKRSFPFVIVGLILLNAGSLIVGLLSDDFKGFCCGMGAIPAHILAGQDILTLFSGMFCHASIAHLAGNMFFLWLFGSHVEDAFHHACFILFYLFCGLVSALVYLAANPHSTIPCVGASGAIAGVMAAYLVLYPSSHLRLLVGGMVMTLPAWVYLVGWFVVQSLHSMLSSGTGGGVAWFAHIGGFLCGIAVTTPMRKFLVAGNSA